MAMGGTRTGAAAERRRLGRTRVEVSALGLGTAPLGGMYAHVDAPEARRLVRDALDAGLIYVDTAPQYGHGTAEERVGDALRGLERVTYTLSTKVGRLVVHRRSGGDTGIFADAPPSDVVFDFSRDGVLRSLEESLERLELDRVDVVYVHDPDDHEDEALGQAYPALEELRSQGVVGAIGVGMNQSRIPTRFVRETDVDVVLIAGRFSLLDRSAALDLLPACLERGVSAVVGGVYNSGVLAGGGTYDYAAAPPEVLARARRLDEACRAHGVPLKAAAIQFPLRHPAVACVLTGVRSVRELEENVTAFEVDVPADLWEELALVR
jgi:D-threo-aldose 1-dehydrogenase